MDTPLANENQLLAEIEQLREQFPQTQDMYREVCVLLFFRHGMTPTANKLYQLVRKGSMTAPAEALNKFWEDLREKSRVRIEHPDLPEALKTAAGDLTATLWSAARSLAQETLATYQSEAQADVMDAKVGLETAQAERDAAQRQLHDTSQAQHDALLRISALEQNLAAANATNASLALQLDQAKVDNNVHQQRLEDARREFTGELEKLRAAAELADDRFRSAETRALLEIDRERTTAAKLQKELDACRTAGTQAVERLRSEATGLQSQLGDVRQKAGLLEGQLQAVTESRELTAQELKAAQEQVADVAAKAVLSRTEAENWRRQAEESRQTIVELRESAKVARGSRKPKAN